MAENETSRPSSKGGLPTDTTPSGAILQHETGRARQVRRLAVVELTRTLYGRAATLGPSPVGPDRCEPGCRGYRAPWVIHPFQADGPCNGEAA